MKLALFHSWLEVLSKCEIILFIICTKIMGLLSYIEVDKIIPVIGYPCLYDPFQWYIHILYNTMYI